MFNVTGKVLKDSQIIGFELLDADNNKRVFCEKDKIDISKLKDTADIPVRQVYTIDNWNRQFEGYLILYHGSQIAEFTPQFGKGEDKHDYGRGFYLTPYADLAKEWAVCSLTDEGKGYLHTYLLRLDGLKVFNFDSLSSLNWLAELMKHRAADSGARYKRFAPKFIEKFGRDVSGYDVICGWRADSSYFSVAKRFVRDEIDYDLISDLFKLGDLERQFCIKSQIAFDSLFEIGTPQEVDCSYKRAYVTRDTNARKKMNELIDSERNTMTRGFTYVMREDFEDEF